MCYDLSYLTKKQIDYAGKYGSKEDIEDIKKRLPPMFHVNGFAHERAPVITNKEPDRMQLMEWGLIPNWVKTDYQAIEIRDKTINARAETLLEKPSYKSSVQFRRCVIIVDGFFEHFHFNKKTYPYFIQRRDKKPFAIAGLWDEYKNDHEDSLYTFTLITTRANKRMSKIHNNPKVISKTGPRMPAIIADDRIKDWLFVGSDKGGDFNHKLSGLLIPFSESELMDFPVRPLRGKEYPGNTNLITENYIYPELAISRQGELF